MEGRDRSADEPSMGEVQEFSAPGVHGEVVRRFAGPGLAAEVARISDPAAAIETINWGRNYLYTVDLRTPEGVLRAVVKQHRNLGFLLRTKRRLQGSKASRSWHVARELIAAGAHTPQPIMVVESDDPEGPSLYVAEHLSGASEVRHFFRRLNGDPEAGSFPKVEELAFLRHLGALARRLHDGGIIYRDLSLGNVLARPSDSGLPDLYLVDFNRARTGRRPGVYRRSRDICRFPILETAHREAFLEGYWGRVPSRWSPRWWIYTLSVRGYLSKHAVKNRLRGKKRRGRVAKGARHHAHIPAASAGAAARDKSVWDHLSDQPHQHAGKLEKLGIRLADSPQHLREIATVVASAPRIWRRYRELCRTPVQLPRRFSGVGVCLRPLPGREDELLSLVDELGVRQILLRLHPWQDDHKAEERLASALSERGSELTFALPQNRDLVRDPQRWRRSVAHLAERFHPFGTHFQVGQAVNRSKWGIWTRSEYVALYTGAAEELRRLPGVELLGPAVIDFELQVTAALANHRDSDLFFDILASLLYVDRRGAPENPQLGFDTVGKLRLLQAIADTGRRCAPRSWVTEVNWPLWEGPHSPAGRTVSVDEETQANYLVRYYLLALCSGYVERVYWWQVVARGYGLVAIAGDGELRRRSAFKALKTMNHLLDGAAYQGELSSFPGSYLRHFKTHDGELIVAWSNGAEATAELPWTPQRVLSRDGEEEGKGGSAQVALGDAPRYFFR